MQTLEGDIEYYRLLYSTKGKGKKSLKLYLVIKQWWFEYGPNEVAHYKND